MPTGSSTQALASQSPDAGPEDMEPTSRRHGAVPVACSAGLRDTPQRLKILAAGGPGLRPTDGGRLWRVVGRWLWGRGRFWGEHRIGQLQRRASVHRLYWGE